MPQLATTDRTTTGIPVSSNRVAHPTPTGARLHRGSSFCSQFDTNRRELAVWIDGHPLILDVYWLMSEPSTGASWAVVASAGVAEPTASLPTPEELIARIRADLSLNVSEVARVLGVERATVYAWTSGRSIPQERNRRRLQQIGDVASRWRRMSPRPLGNLVRQPVRDGLSLSDLLGRDPLPHTEVSEALRQAQTTLQETAGSRERADEAARRLGIAAPFDGGQSEIDWITRKPGSED